MATRRYFHNVSVSGFSSSSESEDGFNPRRDPEDKAELFNTEHGMNDINRTEGALFCEDLVNVCIADGAEDEQGSARVPASNSEDLVVAKVQCNAGTSTALDRDVSRCVDTDVVVDGCVSDQPRPVDGLKASTGDSDSGYETMDMNRGEGQEEMRSGTDDTEMQALQYDGEATTSASGVTSINIYCVCCSQQVESSAELKNRLCKDCIAVMEDTAGNETLVATVSVPCAVCTKRFEKSVVQANHMCNDCISITMHGYETDLGVNRYIAGCSCCQRPFTRPLNSLTYPDICPQCDYVMKAAPSLDVDTPEQLLVEGTLRWTDAIAIQCCTAIAVKTYFRKHFYKWCDGHRNGNEGQEAHQCLEQAYAEKTLRRVCYMMSPYAVVTMIKTLSTKTDVKVGKGAVRVVNKTLWGIHGSEEPLSALRQSSRGCPTCVRTLVEKAVRRWGNRLYQTKYRDHFLIAPRKLVYDDSAPVSLTPV